MSRFNNDILVTFDLFNNYGESDLNKFEIVSSIWSMWSNYKKIFEFTTHEQKEVYTNFKLFDLSWTGFSETCKWIKFHWYFVKTENKVIHIQCKVYIPKYKKLIFKMMTIGLWTFWNPGRYRCIWQWFCPEVFYQGVEPVV